jgi:2-desacetyl-2-hydroxyethyl bacteriochlorophyllide A dehydrogenase
MRAVRCDRFGGPDALVLAEVERPSPISTEILVAVEAAGVNPVDAKTRAGDGVAHWVGLPFVPGWDVAGRVVATGYGVTRFAVGDRVCGMPWFPRAAGGYAQYVAAPSRQFARVPDEVASLEAAALPLAALTAWQCLVDTAALAAGQQLLVLGGAGGVGHLAIQLAKSRGAHVVVTARPERFDFLRSLGADEVVDRTEVPIEHAARDVDAVLDLVGGATTLASLATLRPDGILLAVAEGAGDDVCAEASRRGVRVAEPLVEPDGRALEELLALVTDGGLRVAIDTVLPLERAAQAHERIERHDVVGKLVLAVPQD